MNEKLQGPSAKIICDSVSPDGVRLTTMEVVMHRFILAEFNTHRVFSRNSASSRAIPSTVIRQRVVENPAYPVFWGKNQAGMQSREELSEEKKREAQYFWDLALVSMVGSQRRLSEHETPYIGLHKQLANRLLEPFMWHTAIVTATEWDNFFHQRCHPDAQPEMKALADAMQLAYYTGTPKEVDYNEWHLPYISSEDQDSFNHGIFGDCSKTQAFQRLSTARCARVSYLNHDGNVDVTSDLKLFHKLVSGMHWSPFEHVATPSCNKIETWSGNFRNWIQFRKQFANENRARFIPNLPELVEVKKRMSEERRDD